MSKKAVIIVAVLSIFFIGTIVIVSMNFKLMSTTASDKFWEFLAEQFEKEEKAREETKYGGIGKDTIAVSYTHLDVYKRQPSTFVRGTTPLPAAASPSKIRLWMA